MSIVIVMTPGLSPVPESGNGTRSATASPRPTADVDDAIGSSSAYRALAGSMSSHVGCDPCQGPCSAIGHLSSLVHAGGRPMPKPLLDAREVAALVGLPLRGVEAVVERVAVDAAGVIGRVAVGEAAGHGEVELFGRVVRDGRVRRGSGIAGSVLPGRLVFGRAVRAVQAVSAGAETSTPAAYRVVRRIALSPPGLYGGRSRSALRGRP